MYVKLQIERQGRVAASIVADKLSCCHQGSGWKGREDEVSNIEYFEVKKIRIGLERKEGEG